MEVSLVNYSAAFKAFVSWKRRSRRRRGDQAAKTDAVIRGEAARADNRALLSSRKCWNLGTHQKDRWEIRGGTGCLRRTAAAEQRQSLIRP